jgi:hypothetical protein
LRLKVGARPCDGHHEMACGGVRPTQWIFSATPRLIFSRAETKLGTRPVTNVQADKHSPRISMSSPRSARGRRSARHHTVRGRPPRHRQCMASAALPGQRGGGGLQSPARDHEAELWRAQVVVHLPDRAPRRRSAATGSEALPPIRLQVFWESRSLRIDLHVVPGERKISWPFPPSSRRNGSGREGHHPTSQRQSSIVRTSARRNRCAAIGTPHGPTKGPRSSSLFRNAACQLCTVASFSANVVRTPIRRIRSGCCARATSGRAAERA